MIKKSLAVLKILFFFDGFENADNSKKRNKPAAYKNPKSFEENSSFHYWWNCSF